MDLGGHICPKKEKKKKDNITFLNALNGEIRSHKKYPQEITQLTGIKSSNHHSFV